MTSLCIVGAGAAGAGAAYALRDTGVDVTILERRSSPGGRAATRQRNGCTYDYGANYIKADDRTADLLETLDPTGQVTIDDPVWTFDAQGEVESGDGSDAPKVTYEGGIAEFAERILAATDAEVQYRTEVETLRREEDSWIVRTTEGTADTFDALLLTPPAPQTADLLAGVETRVEDDRLVNLHREVDSTSYRPIRSVLLHYPFRLDRSYYALVNTDREHPIGWISREECKDGHVPAGESLLVAQMSPEWSAEHTELGTDKAADAAASYAAELLDDERLTSPDWIDDHHWDDALPNDGVDMDTLAAGRETGLFFAGDWVLGEGRVPTAFWNGVETGDQVRNRT